MIKNITSKLKNFLGYKKKNSKSPSPISKNKKSLPSNKLSVNEIENDGTNVKSKKRSRKETPEEYSLRHKKRKENSTQQQNASQKKVIDSWDDSVFQVPKLEGKTRFHDLELSKSILHAVYDLEFQYCSEVQAEVLPKAMRGEDIIVQAQTGTGKTAAFLITIFNHIQNNPLKHKQRPGTPRALILAPTRELVLQIEKDAKALGKYFDFSIISLLGGIDYKKQQAQLRNKPCDILVCTPGRLIDFMNKRLVNLRKIDILIIDEADRMLDMGFIPDVKRIVVKTADKAKRQTMFFTATLTADVKRLAENWTKKAKEIILKNDNSESQNIEEITYITTIEEKPTLLYNLIMQKQLERVLVFVNRKDVAKKLKHKFEAYGISSALLTGDIEQNQRIKRLERFREGKVRILVATNVASRGIHIDGITHVISFNMPVDVEEYVHRIGRTGRAGATGVSICFADEDDSHEIQKLEEYLEKKIKLTFPDDNLLIPIPEKHQNIKPNRPKRDGHKSFSKNKYNRKNKRK